MDIWGNVIVAAIGLFGSFLGVFFSNRKSAALMEYRMKELEKKQDKHNNLIERMFKVEERVSILEEKEKMQ